MAKALPMELVERVETCANRVNTSTVTVRLLVMLLTLALLSGCGPATTSSAAPSAAGTLPGRSASPGTGSSTAAMLTQRIEDFEDDPGWSLDSANDYAALTSVENLATSGHFALRLAVTDNGRDKAIVRKEVDLDLGSASTLSLDVFNAQSAAISLALALHATDGSLYELNARPLAPGWNRDLAFSLDAKGFKTGTDLSKWAVAAPLIDRVLIYVLPLKGDCVVAVDNLRCRSTKPGVLRRDEVQLLPAIASPGRVPRYGVAMISADVCFPADASLATAVVDDPWMRRMTALQARVLGPDNAWQAISGYCVGIDSSTKDGQAVYHYRLQLPSAISGVWRYQLAMTAGAHWHWSPPQSYVVSENVSGAPAIGIDAHDPRWFARGDGTWFYPMGENVAWSGDYEPYAAAISAAGGNCMRVWICPWNNPLDVGGKMTVVNFSSADHIDEILAIAARHGLTVELCLTYFGAVTWDWGRNPFNLANGGPCADPREFWNHPTAKDHFRRILDYCLARWGQSSQLFAWELMNEADLTNRFSDDDVAAWHAEMSDYLHQHDPGHHLVTSSVSTPLALPGLWKTSMDIAQVHLYDQHAGSAFQTLSTPLDTLRQPLLVGEWGRGWNPADDQIDHQGVAFRQALWSGWMHGFASAPMSWWWDTQVEPNHLLVQLEHFSAFIRGEDPRGQNCRSIAVALPGGSRAECLLGTDHAYGYVYDPTAPERPDTATLAPALAPGRHLVVSGLAPGRWQLEAWDVLLGHALPAKVITIGDDGATIEVPAVADEFAFKLHRLKPAIAGVHLE